MIDSLEKNEVLHVLSFKNLVFNKLNEEQLNNIKLVYQKAHHVYSKQKPDFNKNEEFNYQYAIFQENKYSIYSKFPNKEFIQSRTPNFIQNLDLKAYFDAYDKFERSLALNLEEKEIVFFPRYDYCNKNECSVDRNLRALLFMVGNEFPQLKVDTIIDKYNISFKIPNEDSKLSLKSFFEVDSFKKMGFIEAATMSVTDDNVKCFKQKTDNQSTIFIQFCKTSKEKHDIINQINESSNDEDYKIIEHKGAKIAYIFRKVSTERTEIQAIKMQNGEMVLIFMFGNFEANNIEDYVLKITNFINF